MDGSGQEHKYCYHAQKKNLKKMEYVFVALLRDDSRWYKDTLCQFFRPNSVPITLGTKTCVLGPETIENL